MSDDAKFDHGPLRTYQITWATGHVETIRGHQVTRTGNLPSLFEATGRSLEPRFLIHGEFDGRWRLVLTALEKDISVIRDVTEGEWVL